MDIRIKIVNLILFVVAISSCGAVASVESALKSILTSYRIPQERLGLYAVDLSKPSHPVLLSVNSDKNYIPASLSKIITATAVLNKFGPSYKFTTEILTNSKVEGEVLKGPIYLKGGGDPGVVSESMWILVNDFIRTGIREVGDIVIDESYFDGVRFDESRDSQRVDRAYDAPIGGVSFNFNTITVYIRPTTPSLPPKVFLDPDGWRVFNKAKTSSSGSTDLRVSRGESDAIFIDGKISTSTEEFVAFKSVNDPATWSGQGLKNFLSQRGVKVSGEIKTGVTPANARSLAKLESKPMSALVQDMMKFSNNFVAEMLTKDLAAKFVKTPAKMEDGIGVIRDTLIELGLKKEQFTFVNPSGLTRKNSFRPMDLVHVLDENYKQFSYQPEFLASFPVSGVDGTLRKRFKKSKSQGWIRAKTGHLDGVIGLAGYAGQKEGGAVAFAFMFNGPPEQGDLAARLFDALASELVQ